MDTTPTFGFPITLIILLSLGACEGGGETAQATSTNGAKTDVPAATATSVAQARPAADVAVSAASIEIKWTGQWKPGDTADVSSPLYSVTNKAAARLTHMQIWHYFYDENKQQLGRRFAERYQLNIPPGATQEIGAGPSRAEIPPATAHIQAVVIGANFGSEAIKFRDQPPAEHRPFSGK